MQKLTIRANIVAKNPSLYTTLILENLEAQGWERYLYATVCPHWQGYIPEPGETGFVTIEVLHAGDTFTDKDGVEQRVTYNGQYFINFIEAKIMDDIPLEYAIE